MVRARFQVNGAGVLSSGRRGETLRPSGDVGQGEMAGRGRSERGSRTRVARVCGEFGWPDGRVSCRRAPSGWEWNRSQPCQGASELGFPKASAGADAG